MRLAGQVWEGSMGPLLELPLSQRRLTPSYNRRFVKQSMTPWMGRGFFFFYFQMGGVLVAPVLVEGRRRSALRFLGVGRKPWVTNLESIGCFQIIPWAGARQTWTPPSHSFFFFFLFRELGFFPPSIHFPLGRCGQRNEEKDGQKREPGGNQR